MTPIEAHQAAVARNLLPIWTVYENPKDFPGEFVARLHLSGRVEGGIGALPPTQHGAVTDPEALIRDKTLAAVRGKLPPGLTRLARDPSDDPVIVEVWI